jgi:hypothetical protein
VTQPKHRSGRKLSLHIEGVPELTGDVRLGAFIEKLVALRGALIESDRILSGRDDQSLDYIVTDLSHSSPAAIEVEPYPIKEDATNPDAQIEFFLRTVSEVRHAASIPKRVTIALLDHIKKLSDGVGNSFERVWLTDSEGGQASLDAEVHEAIRKLLPRTRRAYGSVRGIVKKYSGVGERRYFKIYLPVGDWHVKCHFPDELLEQAREAVERTATIEGYLAYHEGDKWPFEVRVKSLRVHKQDSELPTLSSLIGVAPEATGSMTTGEFLRSLRNDW